MIKPLHAYYYVIEQSMRSKRVKIGPVLRGAEIFSLGRKIAMQKGYRIEDFASLKPIFSEPNQYKECEFVGYEDWKSDEQRLKAAVDCLASICGLFKIFNAETEVHSFVREAEIHGQGEKAIEFWRTYSRDFVWNLTLDETTRDYLHLKHSH